MLLNWVKNWTNPATIMQSNWKNIYFQHFYGHFKSHLRHASDRLSIFLTDVAGRTVKISPSPEGSGFESRQGQQKCHQSISRNIITGWFYIIYFKTFESPKIWSTGIFWGFECTANVYRQSNLFILNLCRKKNIL